MLDRANILALIPHQGSMCLLDRVLRWSAHDIVCEARSHLDPENPLRHAGRLGPTSGIEYGLQAAALHGALRAGHLPQAAGFLASLRSVAFYAPRLDDPALGMLSIIARIEGDSAAGVAYSFRLFAESGRRLLEGRGLISLHSPVSGRHTERTV
jgi:predicted hotdog family 3-hydroxylacyl-ACP dehydratase